MGGFIAWPMNILFTSSASFLGFAGAFYFCYAYDLAFYFVYCEADWAGFWALLLAALFAGTFLPAADTVNLRFSIAAGFVSDYFEGESGFDSLFSSSEAALTSSS